MRPTSCPAPALLGLGGLHRILTCLAVASAGAAAQTTERISVSSTGTEGNGSSLHETSITPDGRFVAFQSEATNLVVGDTNGEPDIFVRDLQNGITTRVSVATSGTESNGLSIRPSISRDGRWVVFESWASNLVAGDTNGTADVFLHDRSTGVTTRRSVSSSGAQADRASGWPAISADGQWLTFISQASTLDPLANNFVYHVFVQERATGITSLFSRSLSGTLESGSSTSPSISSDGRAIAFTSDSFDLVADPANTAQDVYVRDRVTGITERVSVSSAKVSGNGDSQYPSISADGRSVAFQSYANNLVAGDTNSLADVFVRDLDLGITERVSVSSTGAESNGSSDATGQPPGISSDGRYVAFTCSATNLVPGALGWVAVYLRDRTLGLTSFVSLSSTGEQANDSSGQPVMSADGRSVVFQSLADNLVANDTNGNFDLFVRGPLESVWTDMGYSLAGVSGAPSLRGSGTLVAGTPGSLELSSARPSSFCLLIVALQSNPTPFKCGTLVPIPFLELFPRLTSPFGTDILAWTSFPSGLSGQSLYFQTMIPDKAAICGVALSNALRGVVP